MEDSTDTLLSKKELLLLKPKSKTGRKKIIKVILFFGLVTSSVLIVTSLILFQQYFTIESQSGTCLFMNIMYLKYKLKSIGKYTFWSEVFRWFQSNKKNSRLVYNSWFSRARKWKKFRQTFWSENYWGMEIEIFNECSWVLQAVGGWISSSNSG